MVETQNFRFIPAGAGNTISVMLKDIAGSVYPRWRGEHWQNKHRGTRGAGLSPLARGTRTKYPSLNPRRRFIPAGAGNTIETFHAIKQAAVYPRWRGEHLLIKWRARCVYGLSPLARGTPVHIRFLVARSRFIPAGAGNTDQIPVPQSTPSVYPRWRGEHN